MHQRRTRFRPAVLVFAVCLTMGVLDNWPSRFAGLLPVWVASQSIDASDSDPVTSAHAEATTKQPSQSRHLTRSARAVESADEPRPTFDPLPRSVVNRSTRVDGDRLRLATATRERR